MRSNVNNSSSGDYGEYRRKVVTLTNSTYTVLAKDSGSIYLLDLAGGMVITLPSAEPGLEYEFHIKTTFTGTFGIDAASSSDTLEGYIIVADKDNVGSHVASNAGATIGVSVPAAADHQFAADGATKGWYIGGQLKYTAISESKWRVSGLVFGDGTLATPFT